MPYTWVLSEKGLAHYRDCPICLEFYESHPSLTIDSKKLEQKQKKDGTWYHTSRWGRSIHKMAIKEE